MNNNGGSYNGDTSGDILSASIDDNGCDDQSNVQSPIVSNVPLLVGSNINNATNKAAIATTSAIINDLQHDFQRVYISGEYSQVNKDRYNK